MAPDCNLPALAAEGRNYSRRLLQGGDFPVLGDTV
jgi:LysR family malonate utilization transcriptional regulator